MDKLQECAKAFENLLNIQYNIVIGRKGKTHNISLIFQNTNFHHLLGLHKLKDLQIAQIKREDVFKDILNGKITYNHIHKSVYINNIVNRIDPLSCIENLLDNNKLIFQYNDKKNKISLIQANYLLSTPHNQNDVYIFIDKCKNDETFFCRSFFPRETLDYTKGQSRYTMLYKEKIDLSTGEKQIQYDRLTPKKMLIKEQQLTLTDKLQQAKQKADEINQSRSVVKNKNERQKNL